MSETEKPAVPDDVLIRAALRGEEEAFRVLMERYKSRAYHVALGIAGDPDDALDVVQEAFVKAYYKLKEFRFGANFYTWFYRLLVNQAIDRWRKSSRSQTVSLDEKWLSEEVSPPDSVVYPKTPEDLAENRQLSEALTGDRGPSGIPPGGHHAAGSGRARLRGDRQDAAVFGGNRDVAPPLRPGEVEGGAERISGRVERWTARRSFGCFKTRSTAGSRLPRRRRFACTWPPAPLAPRKRKRTGGWGRCFASGPFRGQRKRRRSSTFRLGGG
jgi:RNA polymerase sigma-70 factor (ECF subfamily)